MNTDHLIPYHTVFISVHIILYPKSQSNQITIRYLKRELLTGAIPNSWEHNSPRSFRPQNLIPQEGGVHWKCHKDNCWDCFLIERDVAVPRSR